MPNDRVDFKEIAELLNHSRSTAINPDAVNETAEWREYQGEYRVHASKFPFRVFYFLASARKQSVASVIKAAEKSVGETHLVYPESLAERIPQLRRVPHESIKSWSTRDYLASFINDELETYRARLLAQKPEYYIDPPVHTPAGFTRKVPNPLLSLMTDVGPDSSIQGGALGILLAEPGQGKTYLSRYLVARICERAPRLVPIFIDSSQWSSMSVEDLGSIWKTIAHSFRHFDSPIGWLDGNEGAFLRIALNLGIFRIVFDGFDEYVLRNQGLVHPIEVLETLAALSVETGARILVTSRTSFWETSLSDSEKIDFFNQTGSLLYRLLPFDQNHARNYFSSRISDPSALERAVNFHGVLRKQKEELVGRGFVLSLIADLMDRDGGTLEPSSTENAISWLMKALCQREALRQQLPLEANDQLLALQGFAAERAMTCLAFPGPSDS